MDTSCNHLREPGYQESSFIRARGYLHDLSKPEKEVLLSNLVSGTGNILVENFPDEEDLTQVMQGSLNVLKFKNKIFNPEKCSGMGKVFLRKNLVKSIHDCGKPMNILTLKMFEDERGLPLVNTMFIIQYDYDLDKGFITIPENSVLVFAGGSLSNGTVILNNTLILPAALDIEHFMPVNIRGTYREGSLVYLRKHLRLFDGHNWINICGHADLGPRDKFEIVELLKAYLNKCLDIVAPFKIELIPEKNYVEKGVHDIKVSWNYNRLINNQDIRLESGSKYRIYQELDKRVREYTFENIDAEDPVTIVIATTYKGETVSEAVTLTFDQNPGLVIDDELDENSTNPVTNRAITEAIRAIEERLNSFITREELQNTLDEYASKDHTHDISDINGLQNSLVRYSLSKNGSTITLNGTDGSTSSVDDESGSTEENVIEEIRKLSLVKQSDNIQLTYNGQNIGNSVVDEKGSALISITPNRFDTGEYKIAEINGTSIYGKDTGGSGGGLNPSDVSDLIRNNLDISHSGTTLKLKYAGNYIGSGTDDMRGGGVDPDPEGDGKIGNILVYFLARTAEGIPKTPQNGQKANLTNSDGETWTDDCPDHLDKQYIWMSQIFEAQGGAAYGNWSTPVMIDDGVSGIGYDSDGREFIYARANIEDWEDAGIPNPNTEPDRWPSVSGPWYDNPQGVTENTRFEFYAFRYKIDEDRWSAWVGPFIWSAYGRDGVDGNGVEYIFFKGRTAPLNNNIQNPKNWYTDEQSKADVSKTSFNKDEYILSGSGWIDDPVSIEPGESVWVSIRKYRNDTDTESAEAVGAYWHQYSEPALWSHYGEDAISAGVLDFDNETMTVPVNSETGKNYLFADTAYAYIFYEEGSIPISDLIFDGLYNGDLKITNSHVRVSIDNNKVTVLIDEEGLDFSQIKNYALRFTAQSTSLEDRTGTIKLIGVQSGKDGESYKLSLNTKVVKKQVGTQIGGFIPESIIPKLVIVGGDDAGTYKPTEIGAKPKLSGRFKIKYGIDGGTLLPSPDSIELTNNINNYIVVALLYDENIIDQETIFVIEDGHAGIPATVYNIIPYSSTVVNTENGVTGELTFKASRKYGNQNVSYLINGEFVKTEETGATEQAEISVKLNGTYDITEHGEDDNEGLYTINVESSGNYNSIVVTLSVIMGDSRTEVASIVIPIAQAGSEGTQTLLKGIMRYRNIDNYSKSITFYDGKTPDPEAQNGYFQDFVRWRDAAPNDNWGTYMCINTTEIVPSNIPTTGVNQGKFIKLDYSFEEVVSYLIADTAWIDNLSVRQVVVFDNATPKPNVVAGMTSGNTLPTELTEKNIGNSLGIRIWAGELESSDLNSAPFTVDSSGHLKATDAEITGAVTATSFNVTDNTGIKMRISTWGDVSQYISNESKALIDSNTMSQLIAHPDTAVIVVRDPSSGLEYLLNLISFAVSNNPVKAQGCLLYTQNRGFASATVYFNTENNTWYSDNDCTNEITSSDGYIQELNEIGNIHLIEDKKNPTDQYTQISSQNAHFYRVISNSNNTSDSNAEFLLLSELSSDIYYWKLKRLNNNSTIRLQYGGMEATSNNNIYICLKYSVSNSVSFNDMMNSSNISSSEYNAPGEVYMVGESSMYPIITPIVITRTKRTWTISHQAS